MVFASLLSCLLVATPRGEPPSPRLAIIRDAPDFTLVNQDGQSFKLSDCKGKVVVVSFVFTTCNGTCPATTHRMAKIHQRLKTFVNFRPEVEFVTVTLDPQRDTPEALKKYIQLYDLETASKPPWFRWTFVTGSPESVSKTIAEWGMWVKPAPNGQLDHPSRIFLLDKNLRIREVYNVDLLRLHDVMEDIGELWDEQPK
jgi:protein SCO1/2